MNTIPAEDIEFLRQYENTLTQRDTKRPKKRTVPFRIRLKSTGQFITMRSGKTIWNNIGAAKNALRNDWPSMWAWNSGGWCHAITNQPSPDGWNLKKGRDEEVFHEFITNWVEFVPCPN